MYRKAVFITSITFWGQEGRPEWKAGDSVQGRGSTHISPAIGHPGWGSRSCGGSGDLQWGLQHLHEEGVNGGVPNELEEEEVLQAFQADGAQSRKAQQQLGKPEEKPRSIVTRE